MKPLTVIPPTLSSTRLYAFAPAALLSPGFASSSRKSACVASLGEVKMFVRGLVMVDKKPEEEGVRAWPVRERMGEEGADMMAEGRGWAGGEGISVMGGGLSVGEGMGKRAGIKVNGCESGVRMTLNV